ncbi:MAG: glycosyltransferase family 39 protein, partial [Pseudonocardiaceae bacterium]
MAQRPGRVLARVAVVAVIVVAVVIRFVARSHLWLDEALSVNIAALPLKAIPGALRQDGAPPLYYVLLHGWMRLAGSGDLAVRSLSGIFGVAALPLVWLAGRRLGNREVAWAALVLLAVCPFAIRYSTEARMYSLVVVLVLAG